MSTLPSGTEFFPSTLEHRPLKAVEKTMLLKHFETDGADDMDALAHWENANSPALQHLEAWAWGMRYWGRETLFRVAYYGFLLCKSLWDIGDANETTQVKTIKLGTGGSLQEMLLHCRRWAKIPGEEVASTIQALRGEAPEHWIAREVPPQDHHGVFAYTLIACNRMAASILEPRDEAARMAGQALVCAARALMAAGKPEAEAVAAAKAFLIREMRAWFGRKW